MRTLTLLLALLIGSVSYTQDILSYDDFIGLVVQNHPVSKQALLQDSESKAYMLKALGGFDPKVEGSYRQKFFDKKNYFQNLNGMLKVPTWFGIDLKAGYESWEGQYVSAENTLPDGGLFVAGISVPIGEGLFIDERRAGLKKARIIRESNVAEQRKMLNDLVMEASIAYWNWFSTYHELKVYEQGATLATNRFDFVSGEVQFNNKAAIDTVEAKIQMQNRIAELMKANNELMNSAAYMSVFLWDDQGQPVEIKETVAPPPLSTDLISLPDPYIKNEIDSMLRAHPDYLQYEYKIQSLEVDRKMRIEQLKPTFDINYNPLIRTVQGAETDDPFYNNYKWGVNLGFPLFLGKERGELKLTNVKLADSRYDQQLKLEVLRAKSVQALNDWQTSMDVYKVYNQMADDYSILLDGERMLFRSGESTIFMVNSRENKYLEAQTKAIKALAKNNLASAKVNWTLANTIQ